MTRRAGLHRVVWGTSSQGLNSLSNVLLALLVARSSSPAELGGWGVSFAFYVFVLQLSRAIGSMPLMLTSPDARTPDGPVSVGFALGVVTGLVMAAVGQVVPGAIGDALVPLAVLLPVLFVQDAIRYWRIQRERPRDAALLDGGWLVVFAVVAAALIVTSRDDSTSLTLGWGAGALVVTVVACVVWSVIPRWTAGVAHLRSCWRVSLGLVADSVLVAGTAQLLPVFVAAAAGLASAGTFRAAQTLMGGVTMIVAGLTPLALTAAVKMVRSGTPVSSFALRWSAGIAALSAVNALLWFALPDGAGTTLLGEHWSSALPLLLALSIASMFRGPLTAVLVILKAQLRIAEAVRLRILTLVPSVGCPTVGAAWYGAEGAAWGVAVGTVVSAAISVLFLRHPVADEPVRSRTAGGDASIDAPTGL